MNKKIAFITSIALALLAFSCTDFFKQTEDEKAQLAALMHEHTFSDDWTSDSENHWHNATCEHTEEISDKGKHEWNDGEVTKAATADTDGEKTYTCSVCATTRIEIISKTNQSQPESGTQTEDSTESQTGNQTGTQTGESTGNQAGAETGNNTGNENQTDTSNQTGSNTGAETGEQTETHTHTFSETFSTTDTHHWHDATCGHDDYIFGMGKHTWEQTGTTTSATCSTDGVTTYTCTVCGAVKTDVVKAGHSFSDEWTDDENYHWHAATCEHTDKTSELEKHTWLTETNGSIEKNTCTVCKRIEYAIPESLGAYREIDPPADASLATAKYVMFGTYPQTAMDDEVDIDETISIKQGANTYYKGSDNEWYIKVNTSTNSTPKYRYFKVEPIVWRIINEEKNMILAEKILTANSPFHSQQGNDYKNSNIRAWLNGIQNQYITDNGKPRDGDYDWTGKGFLQAAFTEKQQDFIKITEVDTSSYTTSDKIFLLSSSEFSKISYTLKKPTGYALANNASKSTDSSRGGEWFLRTPSTVLSPQLVRYVDSRGSLGTEKIFFNSSNSVSYYGYAKSTSYGIVPALCVNEP